MSKLASTASEAEINDEILFVHALIESLDSIDDPVELETTRKMYEDIQAHLVALLDQKQGNVATEPQTPRHHGSTSEGPLMSGRSVNLPSRSTPFHNAHSPLHYQSQQPQINDGTYSLGSPLPNHLQAKKKRPFEISDRQILDDGHASKSRRTSESASPSGFNTPVTVDSLEQQEEELQQKLGSKVLPTGQDLAKRMEQIRKAEEERQRARERGFQSDAEFARQLSQTATPPTQTASSQRTTQTFLGSNGRFQRPPAPPSPPSEPAYLSVGSPSGPLRPVKNEAPGMNMPDQKDRVLTETVYNRAPNWHDLGSSTSRYAGPTGVKNEPGLVPPDAKGYIAGSSSRLPGVSVKNESQTPDTSWHRIQKETPGAFPSNSEDDDDDEDLVEITPAEFAATSPNRPSRPYQQIPSSWNVPPSGSFSFRANPPPINPQPRYSSSYAPVYNPTSNYSTSVSSYAGGVPAYQAAHSYAPQMPGAYPTPDSAPRLPPNYSARTNHISPFSTTGYGGLQSFGTTNIGGWVDSLSSLDMLVNRRPPSSSSGGSYMNPLDLDDYPNLPDPGYFRNQLHARGWDYMLNDPAKTKEEIEQLLENIRPDEELPPEMRIDTPVRMKLPLMEHQKLGLTWLKKQEEGTNKGGILADDMGLGKTIQALALMVSRPSRDPIVKTNLIVAPVALMRQWEREIREKIDPRQPLSVLVYHGQSKKSATYAKLSKYDVVLTTFGSLASEVAQKLKFEEKLKENPSTPEPRLTLIGDQSRWYRIIIDEAQCIKNHSTKTAQGAYLLAATHRLCMTGTPMMNGVHELYSLIHFLKIPPYNELQRFNREFKNPLQKTGSSDRQKNRAMKALQALLRAVLLRRSKKSTIDGRPILNLPERYVEIDHAVFSDDEQAFYKHLENKTALQVNKYLKAGTIGKNYSNILVLLLRLRQACCHPHLIKNHGVAGNEDVSAEDMIEFVKRLDDGVVTMIKDNKGSFECPICYDAIENPTIFFPCGHDTCTECFGVLTDPAQALANGAERSDAKCPECRNQLDPKKVFNYAAFRKIYPQEGDLDDDIAELFDDPEKEDESENESEDDDDDDSDDDSNSQGDLRDFIVPDDEEEEPGTDNDDNDDQDESNVKKEKSSKSAKSKLKSKSKSKSNGKSKGMFKGKGKEKADGPKKKEKTLADLKKEGMRNAKAKKRYLKRLRREWVSSAKIDKCMEILANIRKNDPKEKTIIFSQFTSMLDLLEVPIDDAKYETRRYDGSMSATLRHNAVNDFMDKPEITIMLVSLKAGNAGLNLTKASQVIILDPFWNPYVEEQAIDRAHRIGQTREVYVHRILVEGTVEDRILDLQEKKRDTISKALDENAGKSVSRLGRRELAYLFGLENSLDGPAET